MKHCGFFLALWAILLFLGASGQAQVPPTVSTGPDVLVLVFQRPSLGDQVNITYNRLVAHAQVQQDLKALQTASGWPLENLKISDGLAPVQKVRYLTGVIFTAPNVVQNDTHTLPVETFVTAFRSYKNLALIFIVDSSFQFQGWRQYADNNVRITLDQRGSAYTYRATILNSQFDRLQLPRTAQDAQAAAKRKTRASPLLLLLGILVAAAAAGILVYIITNGLTPKPKQAEALPEDFTLSNKETLLGPRG